MVAYNITWIQASAISREAKRWLESRLISPDQYATLKAAHATPLYTPNVFVRIGLGIFTAICVSGFVGLFALMFSPGGEKEIGVWLVFMGAGCIAALEFLIRQKSLHCAGIDDALLYAGAGLSISGILLLVMSPNASSLELLPAIVALPILIGVTIRYADRFTALAAYACLLWIVSYSMLHAGAISQAILPFILMVVSILVYVGSTRAAGREHLERWIKPITILEIAGLVTFYLAGNYLIVRESTLNLLLMELPAGGNIPFAFVFYILTVGIPIAYVLVGLMNRDSILIRVGLFAAAFSASTFRYYFSLGHPEIVLTAAGLILILIAIAAFRYLKHARDSFTHERLLARKFENLDAEMLVVSQTPGATPQESTEGFKPGGGKFGGGGTTESW